MEKNILVTGGAQGIGRSIVETLLQDDSCHVIVIDKQQTRFIEECIQKYNQRFSFFLQDIADSANLLKVLASLKDLQIHGIVNNAGEVYFEEWEKLTMETWDRTLSVNVRAPLQIVHTLRDSLTKGSSIVNISSIDGVRAAYTTIPYAVSKAALSNLTMSLATLLGKQGVRVNAIAPGWVETEMTKDTLPNEASWITPLGRNAKASDIASVVEFLLSPKSSFITGQTITVDGGLTVVDYTLKVESER
jgi:3-oxoacyl-[acyl-carrier protein] reductase